MGATWSLSAYILQHSTVAPTVAAPRISSLPQIDRGKQDLIQKENIIRSLDVESNIQRRERETWHKQGTSSCSQSEERPHTITWHK
mmetsp:Transcript_16438/g.33167  ORF Transcript_16438/g.33167 Transcript_16438/m.33167 type:complete len:86 (-) Transcript_16438:642-899(-)